MNKSIQIVFIILGGVCVILLLVAIGFYLSLTLAGSPVRYTNEPTTPIPSESPVDTTADETDRTDFTLTDAQKQALSSFGIDPAVVPSSVSAAQEVCFEAALGVEKVAEIKAGAVPSAIDFFKAKDCI